MTVQKLRSGGRSAGRRGGGGEAQQQAPGEATFDGEYRELFARWRKERASQRKIFEARREEVLAAHPGKHIAVCEGEVFVADTALGAMQMATQAHNDHVAFYYSPGFGELCVRDGTVVDRGYMAELARGRRESSRQREIFEARKEEVLAAHPGKHIAVCEGEVLAASTSVEVDRAVMRKHPGRAAFFYSPGLTCVTIF